MSIVLHSINLIENHIKYMNWILSKASQRHVYNFIQMYNWNDTWAPHTRSYKPITTCMKNLLVLYQKLKTQVLTGTHVRTQLILVFCEYTFCIWQVLKSSYTTLSILKKITNVNWAKKNPVLNYKVKDDHMYIFKKSFNSLIFFLHSITN